ncbi:very-long-chain (3R)-3-hydroxyacyl-CoA dehydratase-like [Pygocentrus nattereri]|uniref:very-long-chain (3R)-3-hydroxyacyl-CoA dehydratase-like n=1 Tax=Pygocentrus nattereri TaxID=42514 RepID=UPI0018919FFC|nr:very-long-chain (3R)-3-hydroxyacyl-CoA dehydratase-like [Pygocentrus nattereri]XP_037401520.1 very-long-chain (3R)-3-hydroxyacyl-CoA dehydratase-like [Pygocentrus nattereri]
MTAALKVESRNALDAVRRYYLFLYYLLQFLGFTWTFSRLSANLILQGQGSLYSAFSSCAQVLYCCQVLAVLEVVNAVLGLVKTPVFPAMIQVMGRNVILFVVFGSLTEMQGRSVAFYVFYLWSSVEVFRCPFYMLTVIGKEWRTLSWLWPAVWVLLYPLTTVAEAVAVLQALPVFDETGLFSVPLPETVGFYISFSFSLRLYLLLTLFGLFINMRHLLSQRRRCLRLRRD